jgi:hypothetical protein
MSNVQLAMDNQNTGLEMEGGRNLTILHSTEDSKTVTDSRLRRGASHGPRLRRGTPKREMHSKKHSKTRHNGLPPTGVPIF